MTQDMDATTETIDSMQLCGDYDGIREIIQYAVAAIVNDGEEVGDIVLEVCQ